MTRRKQVETGMVEVPLEVERAALQEIDKEAEEVREIEDSIIHTDPKGSYMLSRKAAKPSV